MAIDTGIPLIGGTLPLLPPNASKEDQTAAINRILQRLNQWNGVVVRQGIADVIVTSAPINFATIPHDLGYAPIVEAYFTDVTLSSVGRGSIPLPSFGSASLSGGNVNFQTWVFGFANEQNVYIVALNGSGADQGTYTISYILKRFDVSST